MKILVTGSEGQVARAIAERFGAHQCVFTTRDTLDLADPASIERTIVATAPALVISAGAYTAVDRAEEEPALAMAVNGHAPGVIGAAAARIGAPVLHLSTDYVFDGSLDRPWREDDPVSPLGAYGASKLAGERALAESGARFAILRTAWVYSPFGHNFVKTMLRLAATRDTLSVVEDQFGCPTSAHDIADALLAVIARWQTAPDAGVNQIFHFAGSGETSWAGFARAIFAASAAAGGPSAEVLGIPTSAYPTPARRPTNSRLDCTRFTEIFAYRAPKWEESTAQVVERLAAPPQSPA